MKRNFARILSICIAMVVILASFAGCTDKEKASESSTANSTKVAETKGQDYTQLLGTVQDTSDLPDWTGKQLKLTEWYAHGSGEADHSTSEGDVVGPEAKRVTGVELDKETSYDNGGNTVDVKMAMLSATNDWPDVIQTSSPDQLKQMIMAGKLYDLTELLPKYAPDIIKKYDVEKFPKLMHRMTADDTGISKRIYFIPTLAGMRMSRDIESEKPGFDSTKWINLSMPRPKSDWVRIWVRDDILKKMYPNAKTQDEIEALFVAQGGKFTREQIFDVPLKSDKDFYKFLTDMKTLIDKEKIEVGGKPVETTYVAYGADNWQLFSMIMPILTGSANISYFSYYDKLTSKIEWTFKSDFFKNYASDWQKLVSTGIVSKESLIDNSAAFTEKLNAGHYAVTQAWSKPDQNALTAAGCTFRYRPVFIDNQYNYDKFVSIDSAKTTDMYWGIFKDSVAEEDLPQVISYINYMCSDIGEKLTFWGPRSAGLFTETDGKRVYTDKELESNMAYGKENKKSVYYGLYNAFMGAMSSKMAFPFYPVATEGSMLHPKYVYGGGPKDKSQAEAYFHPGLFPGEALEDHQVSAFKSDFLPDYSAQWEVITKGRDAFEKSLTATLAAKDEEQFNKLWQAMIDTGTSVGMDDKTLEEMNKIFNKSNPNFAEDAAKVHN